MRASFFLSVLVIGTASLAQAQTAPVGSVENPRPIEAAGQGAQDPARSEVLEGHSADLRKCMATLTARRETTQEAQIVCGKILSGVGE